MASRAAALMDRLKQGVALALATIGLPPAAAAQDYYGGASVTGVYVDDEAAFDDDDLDGSALIGRAQAGAIWRGEENETRVGAFTRYYNYLDRDRSNRWSNGIEAAQVTDVNRHLSLDLFGQAATNVSTLEYRSADQLWARARFTYRPTERDRLRFAAAYRHRRYDDIGSTTSAAPYVEADYRNRLGRYNYIDLRARREWTSSADDFFDYRRFTLAGFYTHPLWDRTRLRAGLEGRWWQYQGRFAEPTGQRRETSLLIPQIRLTHDLSDRAQVEVDYRYYSRRSNDVNFADDNHRFAVSLRLDL